MQARDAGHSHITKHIEDHKKLLEYIKINSTLPAHITHLEKFIAMLPNVQRQVVDSLPAQPPKIPASYNDIGSWVDQELDKIRPMIEDSSKYATVEAAFEVQKAIILALITGRFMPPWRVGFLITIKIKIPGFKGTCSDSKCNKRGTAHCEGNRLSVHSVLNPDHTLPNSLRVSLSIPHHKTERYKNNPLVSGSIEAHSLPEELCYFLVPHLRKGRDLLFGTGSLGHDYVFCSRGGKGAGINPQHMDREGGNSAFDALFDSLLKVAPENIQSLQPKLTPTSLRTAFIDAATERAPEEEWESLALAMGNGVGTWRKHYAVNLKSRKIQRGINNFNQLMGLSSPNGSAGPSSSNSSQALSPYQHPMSRPYLPSTLVTPPSSSRVARPPSDDATLGALDVDGCYIGWEWLGSDF